MIYFGTRGQSRCLTGHTNLRQEAQRNEGFTIHAPSFRSGVPLRGDETKHTHGRRKRLFFCNTPLKRAHATPSVRHIHSQSAKIGHHIQNTAC